MRELSAGTAYLTVGPVGDCGLAFRLDTFPRLVLLVPHVEDQMSRLYFGEVKFLFRMPFPGFRGGFHGSAGFWQIGIRGIPSSARLIVGMCGGNKAHLEPAGGIPSGRLAERIP